jgi:hypothetical protein
VGVWLGFAITTTDSEHRVGTATVALALSVSLRIISSILI